MKNFILGTAQLNERYGLLNSKKKTKKEIFKFLEYCSKKGIHYYDTAEGYNNHQILGEFFNLNKFSLKPKIITKIGGIKFIKNDSKKIDIIKKKIDKIIQELSIVPDTILFHEIEDSLFFKKNYEKIINISTEYKIKNFGSSVYNLSDLKFLQNLNGITLQVPLNPANMEFRNLNKKYRLIARSIFLQGLLVNLNLKKIPRIIKKTYLRYVSYVNKHDINPLNLCMNFIYHQKIKNFIVGADDITQIEKIINFKKMKVDYIHVDNINKIFSKKTNDPRKWH